MFNNTNVSCETAYLKIYNIKLILIIAYRK